MIKKILLISIILAFVVTSGLFIIKDTGAEEKSIPETHSLKLEKSPECTECHTDDTGVALRPIDTFTHSSDFVSRHRFYASQTSQLCNACHRVSFCTDCHAYKDELKPSTKYPDASERWLPHRGDYLTQHRVDGRVDPAKCFRCHGRQNNTTCKRCHK